MGINPFDSVYDTVSRTWRTGGVNYTEWRAMQMQNAYASSYKEKIGTDWWRKTVWERRVLKLKQKAAEKRIAKLWTACWVVGWIWGGLLFLLITGRLFQILFKLVLG